jgi:hypothetical protein
MYQPGTYWMGELRLGTAESDKGTPYFFIEGRITHMANGDKTEEVPNPDQRTIFMYLSDKAYPYTVDKLDALGFNGDFGKPALAPEHMAGIWVTCKHETYDGKLKERFELPGGGIEHKAVTADAIRKINAMYRARKQQSGKSATPSTPPRSRAQAVSDAAAPDDLPIDPATGQKVPF